MDDAMDPNKLRLFGVQMVEYVAKYWERLRGLTPLTTVSRSGTWSVADQLPENAPAYPEEWIDIINDVENIIMPGMTHCRSPNFHSGFPAANSYPGICAHILSDGIGCTALSQVPSPAYNELEIVTMNWLARMLNLPQVFLHTQSNSGGGMLQASGSECLHLTILVARDKALKMAKRDEEEAKNIVDVVTVDNTPDIKESMGHMHNEILSYCERDDTNVTSTIKFYAETTIKHPIEEEEPEQPMPCAHDRLIAYTSEEAHSYVETTCLLASVICRKLATDKNYSLRGETLEKAIEEDRIAGNIPFMVVATLGTASCVSFDNITEIGKIANREGLWLHVDAAYAGASFICPEFRHPMNGLEMADSFHFNPNKLLQVNFDCSALWIKHIEPIEDINSELQENLTSDDAMPDFRHFKTALGRRFRAFNMWFVLRMFGTSPLKHEILKQVKLAKAFETLLSFDDRFELVGPNSLGVICFRLKGTNEDNSKLYEKINGGGKIFVSKALVKASEPPGVVILRFAICSPLTQLAHVEEGWTEVKRHADAVSPPTAESIDLQSE